MDREALEGEGAICVADDLVSLAQLTDHSILNCLRERFHDDQIYVSGSYESPAPLACNTHHLRICIYSGC